MRCPGLELSGPCPISCESFCCVIYLSSAHTPGAKHPCSEAESTAPIPGTSQPGFLHAYSHSSACYLCISYRALPRPPQISVVPTLSYLTSGEEKNSYCMALHDVRTYWATLYHATGSNWMHEWEQACMCTFKQQTCCTLQLTGNQVR